MLTMGDRGRLVIPRSIRMAQSLAPGDRLVIVEDQSGMTLMTLDQLEARVRAGRRDPAVSLVDELIADRRAEAARDLAL